MFFNVEPKNKYIYVKGRGVAGKQIVFPTWVPGSYFIREQEKNVVMLRGASLVSKNKYFLTDDEFEYVYSAISKDQRETISTVDYIFINPVSVFPYQDLNEEYCISLKLPNNWVVHTTLKEIGKFTYCARNYDEFADSPIQASPKLNLIKVTEFHSISTVNNVNELDKLSKVLNFLDSSLSIENKDKQSYIFFFRRSDVNFGGIEHENSSAIVVPWNREDLLWLFAHEYVHKWNVKRLKPRELMRIDYERENYTELLWFAEGVTDYLAFLSLVMSKVIDTQQGLKSISNILSNLTYPGIKRMSLAESSKLTWIKLYKRDDNFLNIGVSYYDLGFVVGLLMDLKIRENSDNHYDIYSMFKALYLRFKETGYTYSDIRNVAEEYGVDFLDELVYKRDPPIFKHLSKYVEVEFVDRGKPYIGIRLEVNKITFVEDGSPADNAGLFPGDEIIAVNGVKGANIQEGQSLDLLIIRDGVVKHFEVLPGSNPGHTVKIKTNGGIFEKVFGKGEGVSDKKLI